MQLMFFKDCKDYSQKNVMIGLSGGINSMALLCWLAEHPEKFKPKEVHLFYAQTKYLQIPKKVIKFN